MEITNDKKYDTVICKNTFYFFNPIFQEQYESHINSVKETLLVLKNKIDNKGLHKEYFEELLSENRNGLTALLALTGFSNESFKRLLTVIRVAQDETLGKLLFKDKWCKQEIQNEEISEWGDGTITKLISKNEYFRKGLVNMFFEGSTIPFLVNTLSLFELKKLSISKLKFELPAMIDTLVRYKEKGSYAGKSENNPEILIEQVLNEAKIPFEQGDLTELLKNENIAKRTMDFIIPNKENPKIIIESSFLVTTSSGQGDKSKTEGNIRKLLTKYYPKAQFIGFVDGIGWYVRKKDLKRHITAYDDVFTFHKTELTRFAAFIHQQFK